MKKVKLSVNAPLSAIDVLERCGFSPTVRGEQLQPADLARLADALAAAIEA